MEPLVIFKGQDIVIKARIREKTSQEPIDLTGATEIEITFPKFDGTGFVKSLTGGAVAITSALAGKIEITLDETDTAELKEGVGLLVEAVVTKGTDTKITQKEKAITVKKRPYNIA